MSQRIRPATRSLHSRDHGAVATSTKSRYDSMTSRLHLPSLSVKGFRGIRSLEFPKLGRVTLLAGGNGIGKTTVLDAIRSYVSRGEFRVLVDLLANREEFVAGYDEDGDTALYPDFASLFHDYNPDDGESSPTAIRICASRSSPNLSLRLVDAEKDTRPPSLLPHDELHVVSELLDRHHLQRSFETAPKGGFDELHRSIYNEVNAPQRRVLGILADGNDHPDRRWQSISDQLREAACEVPEDLCGTGTVFAGPRGTRVGHCRRPPSRRADGRLLRRLATRAVRLLAS